VKKKKKSNTPLLSPHPNQESTILCLPDMCLQIWMILCYKRIYIYIYMNLSQQKRNRLPALGVRKKSKNWLNWKNNNRKNQTVKKNRSNQLKILKNRPVRFRSGFISLKQNWNEPKPKKKPEKTESNQF